MGIYIELNNFDVSKRLIFLKAEIKYGAPNYSKMIKELNDLQDMTAEKIAFVLPVVGASNISDWIKGGRPNYDNGEALIDLWKTLTDKTETDIPRINNWSI